MDKMVMGNLLDYVNNEIEICNKSSIPSLIANNELMNTVGNFKLDDIINETTSTLNMLKMLAITTRLSQLKISQMFMIEMLDDGRIWENLFVIH